MQTAQPPGQPQAAESRPPPRNVAREEVKHFQTIYPQYLDAELTQAEGRRLTKKQSVSTPGAEEIMLALRELGYKNIAFDPKKSYPRTQGSDRFPLVPRGCVKVQIKEPASAHYVKKSDFDSQTRAPVVPGLETKHQVLVKVAEIIKRKGAPRPTVPSVAELLAATTPNQPKTKK